MQVPAFAWQAVAASQAPDPPRLTGREHLPPNPQANKQKTGKTARHTSHVRHPPASCAGPAAHWPKFLPPGAPRAPTPPPRGSIKRRAARRIFRIFFSLSSLALFAFWLRSSVVSVLFSLISERPLRRLIVIIPIFGIRADSSRLAYVSAHSVPGITLPPGDANFFRPFFFHCSRCLAWRGEEEHFS